MTQRKSFSVRLRSVAEVMAGFPHLREWRHESCAADLLILSAGFEPRVLAFPIALADMKGFATPATLIGKYQTNPEDNDRRFAELDPYLKQLGGRTHEVDADTPEAVLASIIELSKASEIRRVLFDVSGASSNFIFSVMGSLAQVMPNITLTILYAEAKTYDKASNIYDELDSSRELPEHGVGSVWNNAIFPGCHHDSAKSHIVAFPSLYLSRMAKCLNFCGDAVETLAERNVLWVLPRTDHPDHHWRREQTIDVVRRLVAPLGERQNDMLAKHDKTKVDCDVLSASHAAEIVLNEVETHAGRNLFLVHMGSKLQAVGAAVAMSARREISLVYARPEKFVPHNYSSGVGKLHFLEFPDFASTLTQLERAGQMIIGCADGSEES